MAFLLNIETSTKNCSVTFSQDGKLVSLCEEQKDNYSHSESLHRFIQWAEEGSEKKLKQLDAVCVSAGPGSYTGLRIGLAAAKGICYALDIPLIAVLSFDALLYEENQKAFDKIIPMIDARRMEVYTAVYNNQNQMLTKPSSLVIDESSFEEYSKEKVLFLGDGALKCKEIHDNPNWEFKEVCPSAKNMIELSYKKFQDQKFENLSTFDPAYLKEFIPGKPKNQLGK